jgi:hypothetical protein
MWLQHRGWRTMRCSSLANKFSLSTSNFASSALCSATEFSCSSLPQIWKVTVQNQVIQSAHVTMSRPCPPFTVCNTWEKPIRQRTKLASRIVVWSDASNKKEKLYHFKSFAQFPYYKAAISLDCSRRGPSLAQTCWVQ